MNLRSALLQRVRRHVRLGRALKLVTTAAPGWTAVSAGLVLVQAALPLIALYLMKLVVDAVTSSVAGEGEAGFGRVLVLIAIAGGIALATAVARTLGGLASEAQGHLVTDHVLEELHRKSLEVDLSYYEDPKYFDTLHRAQLEGPFRPQRILGNLLTLGQSSATIAGIIVLLAAVHWLLAALLFVAVIPALIVRIRFANETYQWQVDRAGVQRKANYVQWLLTGQQHAKEVRLYDLGPFLDDWFRRLRAQLRGERIALSRRRSQAEVLTHVVVSAVVFGSYAFIAYQTVQGRLTIGDLVMYFGAVQRGQSLLQSAFSAAAGLYEDNLFIGMLDEFFSLEPSVRAPDRPKPVPEPISTGFAVEGVSFRYPTSDRDLIHDVSLDVAPGEMVALIGANGSGKTTLVKLLCRFYDPDDGIVSLDGVDLRDMDPREYRRRIAVVFQDFSRYQMSARQNIRLGAVGRDAVPGDVESAARRAGADGVIDSLPRGYETMLGTWIEKGEELSLGEWQKIALARAFYSESDLLVLDEPTSALDAAAEVRVFEELRRIAQDRAVLVISHRFSTVRMADRIYVMDRGRIIEVGTHEHLVSLGGTYAHLFEAQAAAYWPEGVESSPPGGGGIP